MSMNRNLKASVVSLFLGFLLHANAAAFPYGNPPETKPDIPLSAAMNRVYDNYSARWPEANQLFSNFR